MIIWQIYKTFVASSKAIYITISVNITNFNEHTNKSHHSRFVFSPRCKKGASTNGGDASRVGLIGNIYLIWHIE